MQTTSSQPRAIYYVVALQIWEYFSFYGMRALLILYLTNQLKYDDNHAYALFSAYCSLVYVTPILGGYLADKLLGNRMAVMLGALLMAIGLAVLARIYLRAETDKQRKDLRLIVVLTAFSLLFWAFAQQGGSSISLYIDRFVNRHIMSYEVPTAMFQSINAFAVMLCGMVLAWLVKESVNGNRTVRIWGKFALGLGLMSAGFCILTLSARWSAAYGQSSMPLMVLGLAVMGFAELFIDPVAMSQITRIEIPGVTGVLTGIYMLLSGAIANYLAGVIADQTSQASFDAAGAVNYSIDAYITVFSQITWGALACVGVVLVIWLYHSLKVRTGRLAVE